MTSVVTALRLALLCLVFVLFTILSGCKSGSSPAASTDSSAGGSEARDSGALTDLAASAKWRSPSCRWLRRGRWILAYAQETALYRAAYELGYIEMEEIGQDNRTGTPEPAWRIELTEQGKALTTAECPRGGSGPEVFGVPVSRRKLISGTYIKRESPNPSGRTVYEVTYAWEPTELGNIVRSQLTGNMAVQEGTYRTRVYLRDSPDYFDRGPNGWSVDAIDDLGAEQVP